MIEKKVLPAHYSPSIMKGNTLYISGQLPIDPPTREKAFDSCSEQTKKALRNVLRLVELAGGAITDIARTTVYTTSIENWDEINGAYAEFFGDYKPARTIAVVKEIHFGFTVEIEAIIHLSNK